MSQKKEASPETHAPVVLQDAQLDDAQGGAAFVAAPVSPIKPPVSKDYTYSGGTCE